jgi:hypothetical protein
LKTSQVLIHITYWILAFISFTLFYSLIGSIGQGLIYAGVSLPLIIAVTYFFIYRAVPSLLFKEKYILFALLTATIFLGTVNIQIVFVAVQRILFLENIAAGVAFVHWDAFYLMIGTILVSLPAISYETLRHWNKKQIEVIQLHQNDKEEYIEVKSDGKTHRILINNICYIESYGDYAHIHLADQKIITRMTLKKLDKLLSDLVRVHRSYVINPDFCQAFNLDEIVIEEKEIPVGRTYKEDVSKFFKTQ